MRQVFENMEILQHLEHGGKLRVDYENENSIEVTIYGNFPPKIITYNNIDNNVDSNVKISNKSQKILKDIHKAMMNMNFIDQDAWFEVK